MRTLAVNFVLVGVCSVLVGSLVAGMLAEKVYQYASKKLGKGMRS